ncbi:MAG: [FeFe] hydrogenase H-cluster maturation GTPase HydF [Pseudobutyrivibrio sp.]|nr:[FeFe] hydrogenase H-cluster maturation GTPase HydF [Pseudobutyrivibrio sp.]
MSTLNDAASANRIHIGVFGKTNSGKSAFINAWTSQQVSIVSDVPGTTTDPVNKPIEIHPLGPCVIMDTAGFDDETKLGRQRVEKTRLAADKADIAIMVVTADASEIECEKEWEHYFKEKKTPVLYIINKSDMVSDVDMIKELIGEDENIITLSALKKEGMGQVNPMIARLLPEDFSSGTITGELAGAKDTVVLVMPQDIQAPKGRLILPQVQVLRELLDKKCHVMCLTTDEFVEGIARLKEPPKLIITDSQVFGYVSENKPRESMLTSFSVLLAAYKGDIAYFSQGAKTIEALREDSKVLIAECCTHAPLTEDIGREKIPNLLRKRIGKGLTIDMVSGTDFPEDLSGYDLIIQCGACMFNRKYVLSRVDKAKQSKVAMTNYGICIAYLTGILDQVVTP